VKLGQYRVTIFLMILVLILVAISPLLANIVKFPDSSEKFSEFWLLGPENTAENYPFNVTDGETYKIFVNLNNHMDSSEDYKIYVKFGNDTQIDFANVSSLSLLYEFQALVDDEEAWESAVTFGFQNVVIQDKVVTVDDVTTTLPIENSTLSVGDITINGTVIPVGASTSWNSENNGFYFRLSFELWHYDASLKEISFHDRIVGLHLNMTSS